MKARLSDRFVLWMESLSKRQQAAFYIGCAIVGFLGATVVKAVV